MFGQLLYRLIHASSIRLSDTVTKSPLAVLRKRTGYSFINCKKALQLHDNDVGKAEEWLHAEAQKEGWQKVEKLKERATRQGLVAAFKSDNAAAMIEVNCETDFVARSSDFKAFVSDVISACHKQAEGKSPDDVITKWNMSSSEIGSLPYQDGKTIADLVALSVGRMGENIILRRALCMKVKDGLNFMVYAHPSSGEYNEHTIHTGNYASLVVYQKKEPSAITENLSELGRQLCQHIIGMNPKTVGSIEDLEDSESLDDEQGSKDVLEDKLKEVEEGTSSDSSSDDSESDSSSDVEEDTEDRLLHQKLVTDPETTVGHLLRKASVEVIDFVRFERGEDISETAEEK